MRPQPSPRAPRSMCPIDETLGDLRPDTRGDVVLARTKIWLEALQARSPVTQLVLSPAQSLAVHLWLEDLGYHGAQIARYLRSWYGVPVALT
jgi:hypothetical protein